METLQTANPPSFETVWKTLDRVGDRLDRITQKQEETAQQMQKTRLSIQELRDSQKETDRVLKENALDFKQRIGHLDNLFGDVAEYMIAPKLC